MRLTTIIAAALAAAIALPAAAADKIELIFADVNPATSPRNVAMENIFSEEIGDEFVFQPYYSSTLMKQGTELAGIQRGNIQMASLPPSDFAQQAPEFDILGAAYVIRDAEHLKAVFASPVGDELKDIAREKLGVEILSALYYGTRQVNLRGDKEIRTPDDMSGIKLRMPGGESWQFLGKALGANPVPVAYAELYTALQTGVVDGQDNPLPNNKDMKFYEVTDQIVLTGHNVGIGLIIISSKLFDSLAPEQQERLRAAAQHATAWSDEQYIKQEADLVQFFNDEGLKVYTPDVAAFQEHAQKMYLDSPMSASWPEGMLDEINKL